MLKEHYQEVERRYLAYLKTGNWAKAEDDDKWIIRIHAYRRTGNWGKAKDDKDWGIRQEAIEYLKLKEKVK